MSSGSLFNLFYYVSCLIIQCSILLLCRESQYSMYYYCVSSLSVFNVLLLCVVSFIIKFISTMNRQSHYSMSYIRPTTVCRESQYAICYYCVSSVSVFNELLLCVFNLNIQTYYYCVSSLSVFHVLLLCVFSLIIPCISSMCRHSMQILLLFVVTVCK